MPNLSLGLSEKKKNVCLGAQREVYGKLIEQVATTLRNPNL